MAVPETPSQHRNFCVWGVIGKTHGLPRAPSSRELSAKLTEGAAERSEADEDKKPAAAAIFPQKNSVQFERNF
jgi:hypothetical protein